MVSTALIKIEKVHPQENELRGSALFLYTSALSTYFVLSKEEVLFTYFVLHFLIQSSVFRKSSYVKCSLMGHRLPSGPIHRFLPTTEILIYYLSIVSRIIVTPPQVGQPMNKNNINNPFDNLFQKEALDRTINQFHGLFICAVRNNQIPHSPIVN